MGDQPLCKEIVSEAIPIYKWSPFIACLKLQQKIKLLDIKIYLWAFIKSDVKWSPFRACLELRWKIKLLDIKIYLWAFIKSDVIEKSLHVW